MKDWTDIGWERFVEQQQLATRALPDWYLLLLKEAWLHGARAAIDRARE